MSEMQIRKELAEKKLSSAARDQELHVEKLTRKLEDATNQLKRYFNFLLLYVFFDYTYHIC